MSKHCMIDLETMGTGNEAAIISIGAVMFDPNNCGRELLDSFHVAVDLASHITLGGKVSGGTIDWWMHPDRDAARMRYHLMQKLDIASVLDGFGRWFGGESLPVWGNGATFDNTVLRNAFFHVGRSCPWSFRDDRCYRTLKKIAPDVPIPPNPHAHDALCDATTQAFHTQDIVYALGLKL